MKKIFLGLLLIASALTISSSLNASYSNLLWPQPNSYSSNPGSKPLYTHPCGINFTIQATPPSTYPRQMIDFYQKQAFKCNPMSNNISVIVSIKNSSLMVPTLIEHESYQLSLTDNLKWSISADYYPGFVRGLQTFYQLFVLNKTEENPNRKYTVFDLPISIKDKPNYPWRGIMIDSARHFHSLATIKHAIDGLLYNKMNVLHWHIIDQDSFPMEVPSRPQLSAYGKIGGTYSTKDIQQVIQYAQMRAIRVVPQIDTPGHTLSWGRSDKYKDIAVKCNDLYQGQFDPTIDQTYQVLTDVMKYIDSTFSDEFVHMGGDEVNLTCWDRKPSIKTWMKDQNISTYDQLQKYYRIKQKKIWRNMTKKAAIYWANQQIDLPLDNQDVIQWWGISKNVDRLSGRPNRVILSNYDLTYFDCGFGNWLGNTYQTYITWRKAYELKLKIPNANVIGAQSAMWSEVNTKYTQDRKLWIRSCSIAERTWNNNIDMSASLANIATRLIAQAGRMKSRGFKVSAVTVGLCQKNPEICFNGLHEI